MASILNRGFNTTNNRFYLTKLSSGDILEFPFFPKSHSVDRQGDFVEKKFVRRNLPRYDHTGGSETVSMSLNVNSDIRGGDDITKKYLWLVSCTFSDSNAPPPTLAITWNAQYAGRRFNLRSVKMTTTTLWKGTANIKEATFELVFSEVSQQNINYQDIINKI
jgi:hypothetical protein